MPILANIGPENIAVCSRNRKDLLKSSSPALLVPGSQ